MAGINNVVLVGRLTKDVSLRSTQNGTMVGAFTLAVDRTTKDQDGNRQADFISCVIWNSKYSKTLNTKRSKKTKKNILKIKNQKNMKKANLKTKRKSPKNSKTKNRMQS